MRDSESQREPARGSETRSGVVRKAENKDVLGQSKLKQEARLGTTWRSWM